MEGIHYLCLGNETRRIPTRGILFIFLLPDFHLNRKTSHYEQKNCNIRRNNAPSHYTGQSAHPTEP